MDKYVTQLENVIKQMLQPLKDIPFKLVINSLYDKKVLPFNPVDAADKLLLSDLINVANYCGEQLNEFGLKCKRANEVGNSIEPYVINSLHYFGLEAQKPKTKSGRKVSSGYPDIYFIDKAKRHNYLECKSFNIETLFSTLRTFYLSPSLNSKIIHDARHIALSYEVIEIERGTGYNLYKFNSWKLLSLENLLVDVKYEFNCDNVRLYAKNLILAENKLL